MEQVNAKIDKLNGRIDEVFAILKSNPHNAATKEASNLLEKVNVNYF